MVYARGGGTMNLKVPKAQRRRFCLTDAEVLELAADAIKIEDHYSSVAGHPMPMDIEWAKDGHRRTALHRPGAAGDRGVAACRGGRVGDLRARRWRQGTGHRPGRRREDRERAGAPHCRRAQLGNFKPGEVLVAESTTPDWEPVMKIAAAIVTDRGGRTCHAAIVARELGVPAVVGAEAPRTRAEGRRQVTVSCAEGEIGRVYEGALPVKTARLALAELRRRKTPIMLNLAIRLAFKTTNCRTTASGWRDGIHHQRTIKVHPMALVSPETVASAAARRAIQRAGAHYATGRPNTFHQKLAEGIGTIAAAFYPKPVIVRLSDFKTNEYARLLGGEGFEPKEENPMLGFRGAARYAHPAYAAGFALECAALRRVRADMGLQQRPRHGAVLPARRRGPAGARDDGRPRSQARGERPRSLRHVRNPQQRDQHRRFCQVVRWFLDRLQ